MTNLKVVPQHEIDMLEIFDAVSKEVKLFFYRNEDDIRRAVMGQKMTGKLSSVFGAIGHSVITLSQVKASDHEQARIIATHRAIGVGRQLLLDAIPVNDLLASLPSHLVNHIKELDAKSWVWHYKVLLSDQTTGRGFFIDTAAAAAVVNIVAKTDFTYMRGTMVINSHDTGAMTTDPEHIYTAPSLTDLSSDAQRDAEVTKCAIVRWLQKVYTLEHMMHLSLVHVDTNEEEETLQFSAKNW